MVPLIGDHLVDDRGLAVGDGRHRFEILSRGGDRVGDRGRIALIGTLDGDTHNGARLHVNRVLGLMREMRAPVLHLGDARVGVVRMPPVRIAALLLARPIQAGQVRARRRLDTRRLREPRQKLLIRLARVAPHDAPQGSGRFERRRVDPDRCALDEIGRRQHLQDPREDGAVGFQIEQAPRPRDRRMLRRRLVEAQPQEPAERQRIGGPPRDAALRIKAFEVPDQEQPEVGPRQQAWTTDRSVERRALRFHEGVKPVLVEHLIQSLIERVPTSPGQRIRGNPQPRRSRAVLATTHGHAGSVVRRIDHVDPPFTTGC